MEDKEIRERLKGLVTNQMVDLLNVQQTLKFIASFKDFPSTKVNLIEEVNDDIQSAIKKLNYVFIE